MDNNNIHRTAAMRHLLAALVASAGGRVNVSPLAMAQAIFDLDLELLARPDGSVSVIVTNGANRPPPDGNWSAAVAGELSLMAFCRGRLGLSATRAERAISAGFVQVNGSAITDPGHQLRTGDCVTAERQFGTVEPPNGAAS